MFTELPSAFIIGCHHIHPRSLTGTLADHIQCSEIARGVEFTAVMSMYRDVQHIWVVPKRSLRAVPVVHIPEDEQTSRSARPTHQSRINTFFARPSFCISLAATATLLKKQNPMCSSGSA
jgi:hypothetical protein